MSLTGELDKSDSPANRWFDAWLPNTAPVSKQWYATVKSAPTLRPQTDARVPGTVGTALDYRLRYYFAATPLAELVAATGMRLLDKDTTTNRVAPDAFLARYGSPPPEAAPATALVGAFATSLAECLRRLQPAERLLASDEEAELCRYCYVLAWFEELFRAGLAIRSPLYRLPPGAAVGDLLALAEPVWIDDLCRLSESFRPLFATLPRRRVELNPIFAGSGMIGGADADLVVDGCLIDIKTTIAPKFSKRRLLYQLLGYVFLDFIDEFAIDAVAIYLSRQALLVRFDLDELITTLAGRPLALSELRASFMDSAAAS
jgi:hypothetical protein